MRMFKLSFALLFVGAAFIVGCNGGSKSAKELVVGKWNLSDVVTPMDQNMPDSLKARRKKELAGASIEFKADNTYSTSGMGRPETGTYSVTADGKTLISTSSRTSRADSATIEEITSHKMLLNSRGTKITCAK